jgi:hypothetical protein
MKFEHRPVRDIQKERILKVVHFVLLELSFVRLLAEIKISENFFIFVCFHVVWRFWIVKLSSYLSHVASLEYNFGCTRS